MIFLNIAPVSPPCAGRFDSQISGLSAARMSSKSPSLLTLRGANSVMSIGPAQSSLCLISSQLRPSPAPALERLPPQRPPVRTSTHEPFSLNPSSVNFRSPFFNAASTSSVSGFHVPWSQSMTMPAP